MLASKIICGSPYPRVTLTWYFVNAKRSFFCVPILIL